MSEFEIKVTITLEGYESFTAKTKEEAHKRMEELLEEKFKFSAPLVQQSSNWEIEVSERTHE